MSRRRPCVSLGDARYSTARPIRSVRLVDREASITLASGVEVILGAPSELALKLAVVSRILPLASDAPYLDVSVPERPVATESVPVDPQVDG